MNKSIQLCPDCGEPMVWTFIFPGSEWFCLNCKGDFPMFCWGEKIYDDDDRYKYYSIKQKIYKNIFKAIEKDYVPVGSYRKGCKKCFGEKREYHIEHLTKTQKLKNDISREILDNIKMKGDENER